MIAAKPRTSALRTMARTVIAGGLPCALLLAVAIAGIDFGTYWDDGAMISKVRRALGPPVTLLPFSYDYPGVTFVMSLAGAAPEIIGDPGLRRRAADASAAHAFLDSDAYRLRLRTLFAAVASLTVLWTAGLSLAIGASTWEALLAATLFATSWEVSYHVRWIAPDGALMQFTAAAVMCAALAMRSSAGSLPTTRTVLRAGAMAAGLATACKYSAWPAVLPVAFAGWVACDGAAPVPKTMASIRLVLLSIVTFFVASPGILLQPVLAVGDMRAQIAHYGTGHSVYTVERGIDHVLRMLTYDLGVLPSPFLIVAIGTAAAAVTGAYALARQSGRLAACVLLFPLCYTAYLSLQRVMIVRNLIVMAPFLAVLAARGLRDVWERAAGARSAPVIRGAAVAAAVAAVAANLSFEVDAVRSIRWRSAGRTLGEFGAWLEREPPRSLQLSDRLRAEMTTTADASEADTDVAMHALDVHHEGIEANHPRMFRRVFGPREVNLNYYPDWIGDDHIVVLSRDNAVRFGVVAR